MTRPVRGPKGPRLGGQRKRIFKRLQVAGSEDTVPRSVDMKSYQSAQSWVRSIMVCTPP